MKELICKIFGHSLYPHQSITPTDIPHYFIIKKHCRRCEKDIAIPNEYIDHRDMYKTQNK